MSFGENLVRARKEKGLSQGDLARLTGTSVDTIRALEQGKNKAPRNFAPFVEALGWSELELRFGRDAKRSAGDTTVDTSDADLGPAVAIDVLEAIAKKVGLDAGRTARFCRTNWSTGIPSEGTLESFALDLLREQRQEELGSAPGRQAEPTKVDVPEGLMRRTPRRG